MDSFHVFNYFWLGGVALIGLVHLFWAIRDVRTGEAQARYFGPYFREGEPFQFWTVVTGKLMLALVVVPFMFWGGLGMLRA